MWFGGCSHYSGHSVSTGYGADPQCCRTAMCHTLLCLKGRPRQERDASGVGNMKDKFALDDTDQEMIV